MYFKPQYGAVVNIAPNTAWFALFHICQDEDEFPDLASGGTVQRSSKPESTPVQTQTQAKLPKNLVREITFWIIPLWRLSVRVILFGVCSSAKLTTHCLCIVHSWITCQKTLPSTLSRHPSPSPPLFPRGPRARGRRLWLLPWPLHRSTLRSAWSRGSYRYSYALCLDGQVFRASLGSKLITC